jgi:hypothetical protein
MAGLPCRIVLKGELSERFERVFEGLSLRCHPGYTELSGTLADQSELQGLLNRLFDLGLQVLSVRTGHECARPDRDSQIPVSAADVLLSQLAFDVVNQLFSVGLTLTGAQALVGRGAAADRLERAVDELDDAIRQIRTIAFSVISAGAAP